MSITFGTVGTLTLAIAALAVVRLMNNRWKTSPAPAFCPVAGDEAITRRLKPIRQKHNMPAMAAPLLPEGMATHFGGNGEANGWMNLPPI